MISKPVVALSNCTAVATFDFPIFYDQHWLCKKIKFSPSPIDALVKMLKSISYKASRTHFSGTGFKTDVGITQIK